MRRRGSDLMGKIETNPDDKIVYARVGHVARLIFNNPARHNAVSLEMWRAAGEALARAETDPEVRVLVVSGAGGKAFVSGADISKFESERASLEAVREYNATSDATYQRLADFPKPTIAAIAGWCIGGGVALASCCDIRLARADSRFGVPAGKLGLGYAYNGVRRLIDVIGAANTMELFFTAKQFTAAEAQMMGYVNRIAPEAEFEALVEDYLQSIAANAPLTLAQVKRTVREALKDPGARDLDAVARLIEGCFASSDYREGRAAFLEKRKPSFRGS
jgi:enoyl-CoA hydratase